MDKEQKKKIKRIEAEATDILGSAQMVTIEGQPFLDAQGEKQYLKHESLDEEQDQRKPKDKTRM